MHETYIAIYRIIYIYTYIFTLTAILFPVYVKFSAISSARNSGRTPQRKGQVIFDRWALYFSLSTQEHSFHRMKWCGCHQRDLKLTSCIWRDLEHESRERWFPWGCHLCELVPWWRVYSGFCCCPECPQA